MVGPSLNIISVLVALNNEREVLEDKMIDDNEVGTISVHTKLIDQF